jgi:hypothetical protein
MSHEVTHRGGIGIISPYDFNEYWNVVEDAFAVHLDREEIRHGLWKEYPAVDQANQIKVKIDRVLRSLERVTLPPETPNAAALVNNAISELNDIINYAVFTSRILQGTAEVV